MSAIADFRLIETSKLNHLADNALVKVEKSLFSKKVIDNYWQYINANSKKLKDFHWSGYIFADLLIFLKEKKGIDLLKGKHDHIAQLIAERRQSSIVIFTLDHKQNYSSALTPHNFTLQELIEFNKDFSEQEDPELATVEMDGIKLLKENLELLTNDDHVVMLSIG